MSPDFLALSINTFQSYKALADKAMTQINDEQFFNLPDKESNSVAILVKHMAGNMVSRWTDFLTTDGEKPGRNRDSEFEITTQDRDAMMNYWESGWHVLFNTLNSLKEEDLGKIIYIRQEPQSVMQAIIRQTAHYSYHVGQIVYLCKLYRSGQWKSLSIPKGQSEQYNAMMKDKK